MSRPIIRCVVGLLALLALSVGSTDAAAQAREPYLQQGTPDSMIVAWRSTAASSSVVCWGVAPGALTVTATGPGGVTDHAVQITGLAPASRYYYGVSATGSCPPAGGGDAQHFFRTAPATGSDTPFTMWVVGDGGTGGARQRAVYDAMRAEVGTATPDIFLHMGDMAYNSGTTAEFDANFFGVYAPLLQNTVVWPTMGNHEGTNSDSGTQTGPYYEAYVLPTDGAAGGLPSGTEAYYAFDYANVHFLVLDSHDSPRTPDGAMLQWAANDLAATDQEWIVAFWHHPAYTDGTHDSDTESQLVQMRENALPILEAAGVDVVLAGHSHIYERSYLVHGAYDTPTTAVGHIVDMGDGRLDGDGAYAATGDGTVYVTAGHGGASTGGGAAHPLMFFSEADHGSCLVEVAGGALTLRNIRWDGVETDHVTLVKRDGIVIVSPVGGERYVAGSDVDVVWSSMGTSGAVRIEYSLDDGGTWATIIGSTPDDGSFVWTTPRLETSQGRVRVTDVADASLSGQSPGPFTLSAEADVDAIPLGSVWEYRDDGVDPGATWSTELGGWAMGPAQLGYGDGDEATVVADVDPNHATYYFRRAVTVDGEVTAAHLRVLFDDGFAVFVNGTQVFDRNVDSGLQNDVYASAASADNEIAEMDIDPSVLVAGENVVAVLVKQANDTSSDLSFDLSLTLRVRVPIDPPPDGGVPGVDGGGPRADGAVGVDGGVDDGGGDCSCRAVGASRSSPRGAFAFASLVALGVWRRRRRR